MYFDIGDEVIIKDGSYSMIIKDNKYHTFGLLDDEEVFGIVLAVDCRLPIGPSVVDGTKSPCEGMPLALGKGLLFNDILLKTAYGFIFTSSKFMRMKRPEKYKLVLRGIEIDITEQQHYDLLVRGVFHGRTYISKGETI